jgi:hypothetical protein
MKESSIEKVNERSEMETGDFKAQKSGIRYLTFCAFRSQNEKMRNLHFFFEEKKFTYITQKANKEFTNHKRLQSAEKISWV